MFFQTIALKYTASYFPTILISCLITFSSKTEQGILASVCETAVTKPCMQTAFRTVTTWYSVNGTLSFHCMLRNPPTPQNIYAAFFQHGCLYLQVLFLSEGTCFFAYYYKLILLSFWPMRLLLPVSIYSMVCIILT